MPHSPGITTHTPIASAVPNLECLACLVRQAIEAAAAATPDTHVREAAIRQVFQCLVGLDWRLPAPALAQRIHRLIRGVTGNPDPYAALKQKLNGRARELDRAWHDRLARLYPPLEAAVRLAIVGNLLDAGAKTQLGEAEVLPALERALEAPLMGSVEALAGAIAHANNILYLADNAGEIVFDRWLLAHLPLGTFSVVVRGEPVLNDATVADARNAGLDEFCEIIGNGSDAPGTILEECSPDFRKRFDSADLVIAKGQGNYESLAGVNKDIFYLFTVKCAVVGGPLGYPLGSLVIHRQSGTGTTRKF
jgi:uncharacterized protein with ATP-grasp and redox domains